MAFPSLELSPVWALLATLVTVWAAWPWLAPARSRGPELIVVLDGQASRLKQGDRFQRALQRQSGQVPPQRLLIRVPRSPSPPQPMPQLLEGFDTATQIIALAAWLQRQPAPAPRRVWIATDPDHTARAVLIARLVLAPRGIQVAPSPAPPPSPGERLKLLRDGLRLTLWRATGSTGAWLVPWVVAQKRAAAGL